MILLDTNIVSALMQSERNTDLVRWLDRSPPDAYWLTAISVFELRFGIEKLAVGRRRQGLQDALNRILEVEIRNQILSLDDRAAAAAASIAAARRRIGRPADLRDTLIAGIAAAHRANLATRNVRHFQDLGISVIDPFADRP